LVSSASMIFHPSPASETSALSRIQLSRASAFAKEFLQKGPFFKAQFYDVLLLGHESSPCFKQQGCLIHEYDSTSRKRDTRGNSRRRRARQPPQPRGVPGPVKKTGENRRARNRRQQARPRLPGLHIRPTRVEPLQERLARALMNRGHEMPRGVPGPVEKRAKKGSRKPGNMM